jgi:predicted alpha/beta-hydrolase family hydrolase
MSSHELIDEPSAGQPLATVLLAHGAGAPMDSDFMQLLASELSSLGLKVVRFEFPFMQQRRLTGSKRPPDRMPRLLECFRLRTADAEGPVFIAGKSMGGRVASMLAEEPGVTGVICFGYPFHPPGKPEKTRIAHLQELATPILVLQGTRDPLGTLDDFANYPLSACVQLHWLATADHDFKPLKASGRTQSEVIREAAELSVAFCRQHLPSQ